MKPQDIAYDDTLLADTAVDFTILDREVDAPESGDFEIMLLIDELVDELVVAAEDKVVSERLEIALSIDMDDTVAVSEPAKVIKVA
ncbi:MAG: hypothetical protein KC457_26705 [Myxococcales bacterium]|nr:hypothetical protein [Myxococcales bacterium]